MSDFDDMLSSIGINSASPVQEQQEERYEEEQEQDSPVVAVSDASPVLSDDDFNAILNDNGIVLPETPEEIQEEEDETESNEEGDISSVFTPTEIEVSDVDIDLLEAPEEEEETPVPETPEPEEEEEHPSLPVNSPSLLIDETTSRFSGASWYREIQKKEVIIAGIGGIGSNLAFQIARMTPAKIVLYDDDIVETGNMSGQLFSYENVGLHKVSAIHRMISSYTNAPCVFAVSDRFTEMSNPGDIMMCGFDNMRAREVFFSSWLNHVKLKPIEERKDCLYLDGRLSIDTLQVLCIRGDDEYNIERYVNEFLFSDAESDETVCSMKQTTYLACMIASVMTNLFTNFVANQLNPVIPFDLPFFVEYDAQNMIFKTTA